VEASVTPITSDAASRENSRRLKGWLKFLGIVNIVAGGLQALSFVGIFIAWLPIWLGITLVQAGSQAQKFADQGDTASLAGLTGKLRNYFTITGIVTIVALGLMVLSCALAVILLAVGFWNLPRLADYWRLYR